MLTHQLHVREYVHTHNRIVGTLIPAIATFAFTCIVGSVQWGSPSQAAVLPLWVMQLLWAGPSILMLVALGLVIYSAYLFRSWWGLLIIPAAVTAAAMLAVVLAAITQGWLGGIGFEWDILTLMVIAPAVLGTPAGVGMAHSSAALHQHYTKKGGKV